MPEITVYLTYKEFLDRINSGREEDYILTQRLPQGVTVSIGEVPLPRRSFLKRLSPYREERAVVCVGRGDNARPLLAINPTKLEALGGKLGNF